MTSLLAAASALLLLVPGVSASGPLTSAAGTQAPAPLAPPPVTCGDEDTAGETATTPVLALADHQEIVSPRGGLAPRRVSFGGATVTIPTGAVNLPVGIGVTGLGDSQLPKLDAGMTNVTARRPAGYSGYRFTPHPYRFLQDVEVSLPYDPTLLGDDFTPQDVFTYYWSEAGLCWQILERVAVDEVNQLVISRTDHFTDMINATVVVPEHPEGASFNPNELKGIQAADPAARVNLIGPPNPNNQGDNRLSYPIEVPPGRGGVQPSIAVSYDSSGGNGWVGVGWDVATSAVVVDTRWGVPRYNASQETETYLVNGEQVTPVAHRGPSIARTPDKVFHSRVEGAFSRIIRLGGAPNEYSWETTDKDGTRRLYGGAGRTLTDQSGNIFLWALREVIDANGNSMHYHYAKVDDAGVSAGAEPGTNLYLQRITYTGRGDDEGRYAVTFVRDRELGEPLRVDKGIDGRGGFKRVTADLLRRVDVTLDTTLIRRYELSYAPGAFHKTLLRSITQFDGQGVQFNRHQFDYFDDIRDGQGAYQAFEPAPWTSPGDGLSRDVLNLTPEQAGDASALNANTSIGGGGHLYVGVGTSPSKSGSVGVKAGFSHSEDEGLLALIDVDGDALPDKVFRDGGIKYRKNLSGPRGELRFSAEVRSLNLPGIGGENSNSLTLGIEGYLGAVAAQLDYVNTFSTTSQYFTDVNGDGITDLVNGSSVLFGRIGPDGTPVYGVSGDTPVPVGAGLVDTDGLFGDFAADRDRLNDSFPLLDSVRRWVAPYDGTVRVDGAVSLSAATAAARAANAKADGVRVAVQHEDTELWSDTIGRLDNTAHTPTGVDNITVLRGQRLYFRVQSVADGALDEVSWNPSVSYVGVPDPLDVNGLPFYRYLAARDFTLGGRDVSVKVPLTGTMHLSGDVTKSGATTDDVTVLVTRDGTPVLEQTIAAGTTGTVTVDLDVSVTQGQTLAWRLKVDSPIDVDKLAWTPRAFYTAANGVDRLVDDTGRPLIDVFPPYSLDLYPDDGLTAPQGFFTAPATATVSVEPTLTFNFRPATPTGRVAFTVKRRGELLAKRFFDITNGVVTSPGAFDVDVNQDDELFFDFSTLDPTLRPFLTTQSVTVDTNPVPSAFHSAVVEGAFPQPYRGWGAIGYNGNKDRATQPITQNDLVVDENFGDQLPDSVDPQGQQGTDFANDPRIDPPKVSPFAPQPRDNRWADGEHSWVARDTVSSSRRGVESINLPTPGDFADATAVPRLSRSEQISLTGGVGFPGGSLGGSVATGDSEGQVDFIDLNGDGFPDVVGAGGVQYSDPVGGLGATRGSLPDGAVRRSSNISGNASAGSAARTISTGRGYASPPGHASNNTSQSGNDMPPLGVGGNFGGSSSDTQFDLIDMNGDGLPDRVYADGRVALNLGYRFGAAEQWRNPAPVNDGEGTNGGINIGFNTDFYGFAGGASYNEGSTSTNTSLADVNGDGLVDRVFAGQPITVALNTGNGFEPAVPFLGSLDGVNNDQNAKLGGGVYFTFSICFIAVCVIFNPGGDISTGASRSERSLKDIDGDGYPDHLSSTKDDQLIVARNRVDRTNLLRGVTRPLGARLDFDYTRDGNTYDHPQSKWLLTRVVVRDGLTGDGQDTQLVTYDYRDGVYDRLEREFYGYGTVVEQHRDAGNGEAVYRTVSREFRTDSHYTTGLLTREVTADGAGHMFLETVHTYTVVAVSGSADVKSTTSTLFPQLTRTERRFYEGQAAPTKSTFTTMEYDALGNIVRSFDAGDSGAGDDVDTRIGYANCPTPYIVGTANSIDVFGAGTLMRHRESTVDCVTGDVTQVRARLANGDEGITDLAYFPNGNIKAVTGPANSDGERYRLEYAYDTTVDTHVESITDSFGLHSTATHNFLFGTVEDTTDFNGQVVRNTYDSVGRMSTVIGPYEAGGGVTISFEYHPEAVVPYAVTRHIDREANGLIRTDTMDTITFVDGLGRTVQTKKDATVHTGPGTPPQDVMVVSGRAVFDFLGRVVEQYYPTTEPKGAGNVSLNEAFDAVTPTRMTYDVIDRTTSTRLPDNTVTTLAYGFGPDRSGVTQFETVTTDPKGKVKRTYSDVTDLTTSVKELNPGAVWTSYGYDPLGQLTSIVDDHGNTTTAGYDNFGRRTFVDSPDMGRTETRYDLAGNQIAKATAKLAVQGVAIEYDYEFNRLAGIRYPVFPANNVTYTYGAPGAPDGGAGRVVHMVDGAGLVDRKYGPLGELVEETRTTPAQGSHVHTLTTKYRYDTWNRMLSMQFPDGETLTYHYNSGGQVDRASGVKGAFSYTYLARLDYDKFEQRVLLDTGTGTRTTYSYNAADRRLGNITAAAAGGALFQNQSYSYDQVGNITSIVNNVAPLGQLNGPSTQTFQYDDMHQMTHAEATYQDRGPKLNRYRVDYTYDSIHNLTRKNQVHELVGNGQVTIQKPTTYDNTYTYAGAQPHAPTSLGIWTIAYDENGNQVSREQQPRPRRQMIWDEENRLACSHENVQSHTLPQTPASCDNAGGTPNSGRYFYDDQGNRVVKDSATFHIYPNQNYSTDGNKEYKHIYIGPTKLLTKFVEPAHRIEDRQFYAHTDHLGSTGYVTDQAGGLSEHVQYFAGGETWVSERPSQPVPHLFTGKEFDPETNLYYFGARYYDPVTQQWQTPDPVLDAYFSGAPNGGAYNPLNLALYTYSYNNPIRLADPDGRFPWNRVLGGVKLVGGIAEAAAGVALGAATSWTGVGAVAGGAVAVHGVDVAISGARQLFSGEETSSFTSSGLQAAGVSKQNAELIDSAISIVGSAGAGAATNAIKGAAQSAPRVVASAADDVAERAAPRAAGSAADDVARIPCVGNSFTPDTRVLMADGSTKPIAEVRVGEKVLARDPLTGEYGPRAVTNLIVGFGVKHLVDITVDGDTITATDGHPFWSDNLKRWIDAKDLVTGDRVLLADGRTTSRVDGIRHFTAIQRVHNFTVDDLHTYYVVAGDEAILVHNTPPCGFSSGKPPHTAQVQVTRNGETVVDTTLRSGSMTAEEAAMGFPKSSLATHTEARAARSIPLQAGDEMVIRGQYPPCPSCRGYMNRAARESGASVRYEWPGGTWTAKGSP